MNAKYSNQTDKNDMYSTALRYTDHQIGYIVEQIKKIDDNTIIIVTGDHGAREVNIFETGQKIKPNISDVTSSSSGMREKYSGETLFSVGAMISYLGKQQNILDDFTAIKNKTFM